MDNTEDYFQETIIDMALCKYIGAKCLGCKNVYKSLAMIKTADPILVRPFDHKKGEGWMCRKCYEE